MFEMKVEATASKTKPSVEVLDKTFEVLKKAGFPEDKLKEAYEELKECTEETKSEDSSEMEVKNNTPKNEQSAQDPKTLLMRGMKSLFEKMGK